MVVPKKFWCVRQLQEDVPLLSNAPSPSNGAGLGQLVHILSTCVHKQMPSQARHLPFVPCPIPPPAMWGLLVADDAGLGQLVHIVCLCVQVSGISGQMSPFVPSCPLLGLLVACCAGLGQLVHIICLCSQVVASQAKYMAPQARRPPLSHHALLQGLLVVDGAGLG